MADLRVRDVDGLLAAFDEAAVLALALTVRGTRHGSVVLDLADAPVTTAPDSEDADLREVAELPWPDLDGWTTACAASPLGTGDRGPVLRQDGTRLWLDRYWRQEDHVATELRRRVQDAPADLDPDRFTADLAELFPPGSDTDQRDAVAAAARARVSVIGGGPGTGKTTTVARLITVLLRQRHGLRVALAAPTGKAAARLAEALRDAAAGLSDDDRARLDVLPALTVHKLLGWRPDNRSRFRHDRDNRLPYDLVVVDESSMLSLTMTARLLEALPQATRLVLVGDPDQLASVEAGAVLGDIVASVADVADDDGVAGDPTTGSDPLRAAVSVLRTVHRYAGGGPIARLATHVRQGDADEVLDLLRDENDEIEFVVTPEAADDADVVPPGAQTVLRQLADHEAGVIVAARAGDADTALDGLERHRLLCAHRGGPRGVRYWSDQLERRVLEQHQFIALRADGRYAGQPLLVTANDYDNELWNGDTGVVIANGDGADESELVAAFRRGTRTVLVPLVRLADVRPLHAMTIHRAQGSQFGEVSVLLPRATSPLANRQTFYTAITRASERVRIVGSEQAVRSCVERAAARATGLRERLRTPDE